jgi:transposase-like protein
MSHYLGYEKGQAPQQQEGKKRDNHRNGTSKKTLLSEDGKLEIEVPRDRTGEVDPQFIRKGQRRFGGFDQKIIAMYAQGMTVREIQRFLEEQYKVEVSADLISTVTDSVLEDVVPTIRPDQNSPRPHHWRRRKVRELDCADRQQWRQHVRTRSREPPDCKSGRSVS